MPTPFHSVPLCLVIAACTFFEGHDRCRAETVAPAETVDFSRQVRPILSDKCFKCHGPDEDARQADLRLDRRETALEVLSVGNPADSELLRRISSQDTEERMPPISSKMDLTEDEIATLRRWIKQGAPYQQHWAFVPVPSVPVPSVNRSVWPRNEIDHFVLSRLQQEQLEPAAEANKELLIRRLSFDLTGLPPTLDEIDEFLQENSDQAYERLVDRLLEKQEYGERMTADWLDLARYSDTYGYQVDRDRFVWPWRDWVIRAFNQNMPYDEFITWQLAGDLLPGATDDQILATTFNRLHPQKVEGGSVPEEFRVEYVADRTHTLATAFLGLTLECARCHDHKYDPITQQEYYQLFAFFNSIDEAGLYSYFTPSVPTPTLLLADEATKANIAEVERKITLAEDRLASVARREEAFQIWLAERPSEPSIYGQIAHLDFEDGESRPNLIVPGKVGKAVKLTGDDGVELKVGNFRRYQPFSVALWISTPDTKDRAVVFHRSRAWTDAGSRGYQLLIEEGKLSASLIHFWPGNAIRVRTQRTIPTDRWIHVTITYDGSSRAKGLRIYVDGKPAPSDIVRDNLYKNITGGGGDNITIGQRFRDRGFTGGMVDEFAVFDRQLTPLEVSQLSGTNRLGGLLSKPLDELTEEELAALREYYLASTDSEYKKQLDVLRAIREQRSKTVDGIQEIMVMRELRQPRPTHLLKRGAYDAPADLVSADTPAIFPPMLPRQPRNRLGLARWLVSPSHPLTSRVAVNHYWQMCFGQGLVRTPEDFGSQGSPPTHPRLLDWLAGDFVKHGWDVKRLLKKIVMSATYRQSSIASPALQARDPDNLLLARAPRYRLPAEMIRDNALAVSGLLANEIGGPPVRPYEVSVSFKPVKRDTGDGLYRRSLYTFWKRTAPAPVMMTLDASKRDVCTVKRARTSSPLQALVLLNDPQFVEAARALGQRLLIKHSGNVESVIVEIFRLLTSRFPSPAERAILDRLYKQQLAFFENNTSDAEQLLATGDFALDASLSTPQLAAVSVLANTLLSFDECVVKR